MRREGLVAIQSRSFVPQTTGRRHNGPFNPNLLLNTSPPIAPSKVLVSDITYIPLAKGGWVNLAAWMDLYPRLITGSQLELHMEESLVNTA